jgi:hypothetical protein
MSVIRQQLSMIEAYDMDGWKGARWAVPLRSQRFVHALFVRILHRRRLARMFMFARARRPAAKPATRNSPNALDPWKRSREKLRPTAEIAKARAKIFSAKLRVRELFKQLEYPKPHADAARIAKKKTVETVDDDEAARESESESDDSGIDAEDIFCAACGRGDADDDDDILLCDGFCEGAYHMSCLDPPVTKAELAELGDEDDDWMCRVCDARVDAFYALNAIALPRHVDAATATWHDVFPEEAALDAEQRGPGQANDPAKHFT